MRTVVAAVTVMVPASAVTAEVAAARLALPLVAPPEIVNAIASDRKRTGMRFGLHCLTSVTLSGICLSAQSDAPRAFEVASVKLNKSGEGRSFTRTTGGRVEWTNVTLKMCISMAYNVHDYSLSGPDWLSSVRVDIVAKPSAPEHDVDLMMQTLLMERFKLVAHRESRSVTGYALVVGASGAKIHSVEPGEKKEYWGIGTLKGESAPMTLLTQMLAARLHGPVEDNTGLPGVFNFTLTWSPDDVPSGPPSASGTSIPDGRDGPSIFSALREQLGLRLEARKVPIQILVVDHVEKIPTEN